MSSTDTATFFQLASLEDWKGVLQLESQVTAIAKACENTNPKLATKVYGVLGMAHENLSKVGGVDQAIPYFRKTIKLGQALSGVGVDNLSRFFVKTGRVEEAMDLHKSLCTEIGWERVKQSSLLISLTPWTITPTIRLKFNSYKNMWTL